MKLRITFCGTAITCAVLIAPLAANASFGPLALPGADTEQTVQIRAEIPATFEIARGGNSGSGNSGRGNENHGGNNGGGNHGGGNNGGNNGGGMTGGGNNGGNESGSGRSKPRIPGGSGCDDAGDILEHPECSP